VHEVGIGFTSTSNFAIRYQWGTDESINRITAVSLGVTTNNSNTDYTDTATSYIYNYSARNLTSSNTPYNISGGFNFSHLKIVPISQKFGFMYGVVVGFNFSYLKNNSDFVIYTNISPSPSNYSSETTNSSFNPLLGLVTGVRYKINSSFHLYAEIAPSLNYTYSKSVTTNTPGVNTPQNQNTNSSSFGLNGLNNSGALLTIVYRI
jgi:hypothetical protein